jgi:hypothetical protein
MSIVRRLLPVIVLAAALGALTALGVIGSPTRAERFDAKTIVLAPTRDGALRVTEFVDIDFGTERRRGYERVLRTDLGEPTDIAAGSPTVSDRITTFAEPGEVVIRVGDPDVTVTGRHRIVLAYTLPAARLDGPFDLSVIDPGEEFETGRFTVVLDGFRLDDALCSVGDWGTVGGCELAPDVAGRQSVTVEPLAAGDGLNLSGRAVTTAPPTGVDPGEPFPDVARPATWWRAALVVLVVLGAGWWVVSRAIRRGMNAIGGTGVSDAGGAALPVGGGDGTLVTDDELAAMVTTEFAPPQGVAPWEGRALLDEAVPDSISGVWVSSMLGGGVLTATEVDGDVVLGSGPATGSASPHDAALLARLLPGGAPRRVGRSYDPDFADVWSSIAADLGDRLAARQWWTGRLGSSGRRSGVVAAHAIALVVAGSVAVFGVVSPVAGNLALVTIGAVVAAVVVAFVGTVGDLAARTAAGSAAYLRVASFRRFLAASEGRHVDEAHRRGVLREYTAWAVALGEADAWERAAATLGSAAVLATVTSTAFMHHHSTTFSSATTAPSSSSAGGGGGGGGVGGGGGGGSSGSW